jgi:MscS family membrane protein
VIDCQIRKWVASTDNSINEMLVPLVSKTVRIFVIVVGGMMVLQNVTGIEIGPLVASLGIEGLAFALAGKDSIANFLGSLTILLDKPFHAGERIVIDKHDGFVEGVGFRSTRIRTLKGSLVSIPNEKIINSTLENIGRRTHLRWQTNLGLTCATPPEKVEVAVEIIQEILCNHEGMREDYPPRVFFNGFNDWNLNISVNAWYFPADYWKYQEWLQKTCLEIMRRFREEDIELAYPTQTIYQLDQEQPIQLAPRSVARQ